MGIDSTPRRFVAMRRSALAATLLALALPGAAAAASFDVRGGGWGHAVGMGQHGAQGFALEGRGYKRILFHYYRDTRLRQVEGQKVRVLLQESKPAPASFSNAVRAGGKRLRPDRTYTVGLSRSGKLVVRNPRGERVGRFDAPLRVEGDGSQVVLGGRALNGVNDGRYRGALVFRPGESGGITAVNAVGLDPYVRGVIPGEMPASWHGQALRAQAVAARSYALATDVGGRVFDQYPDTRSQVYLGVRAEEPSTNRATRATAREVLRYQGEIATTYFHSSSGGHTEHVENIFGGPRVHYLRGVEDPYDGISPRHRWTFRYTRAEMQDRLGSLVEGRFRDIKALERGASPRMIRAKVVGSQGSNRVRGTRLRELLDTYDIPTSVRPVESARTKAPSARPAPAWVGARRHQALAAGRTGGPL